MKRSLRLTGILTGVVVAYLAACTQSTASKEVTMTKQDTINRGAYLVKSIGCDDCHSPKVMGPKGPEIDMALRFSGYPAARPLPPFDSNLVKKGVPQFAPDLTAAAGAWGITFAANISSDATGIGNWTEEQFLIAMREGKTKGLRDARPILPPMPWFNFANLTDGDLKAMFAYLKSTKPVENVVPAPKHFSDLK